MSAPRWWRRWPAWAPYAAALWSLAYGALGLYWTLGGAGFPFGAGHDPAAHLSVLGGVRREGAAPVVAALGLAGAVAAAAMARGRGRGWPRVALLALAWTTAAALAIVIPDFRLLVIVAYAPILVLGAPFGWPSDARFLDAIPWPVLNQGVCVVGGLAWAAAALAYQRVTRGACGHCGRTDTVAGWTTPAAAARWGRWATGVAVAVPVLYALTRWTWALGIPLGLSGEFYREGQAVGLWWIGAALATLALVGAALTLGLVRPWGERVPRRVPFLGGRRVPRALVVVPAVAVAVVVTSAGLMFLRMGLAGTFRIGDHVIRLDENWAALAPELLWPAWGVALGAAALAYHYRTRGRCAYCGRGEARATAVRTDGARAG
ncbi:MAG TPA: hypothetical protein VF048_03740 [Gemmatimonadaceae bacterium]